MGVAFALGGMGIFFVIIFMLGMFFTSMLIGGVILTIVGSIKKKKRLLIPGIIMIIIPLIQFFRFFNFISPFFNHESSKDARDPNVPKVIIEALETEDVGLMKSLFSNEARSRENLDEEILKLYEYIEGDIVSYNIEELKGSQPSDEEGVIDWYSYGEITNINTDLGNEYSLKFNRCDRYSTNENLEGVMNIKVTREDGEVIEAGIGYKY